MTADEYLYETDETNRPRELAYSVVREPPEFGGYQAWHCQKIRDLRADLRYF